MIKKLAWNTFKNTGNINTFLELHELENVEKSFDSHIEPNNTSNPYLNDALNKNIENNSTNKNL